MSRIFVVEDDALNAALLTRYIQEMGHEFAGEADNAEAALAQISQVRPDLVLMDIQLKGAMDGIDLAAKLQSVAGMAVIYITAYADEHILARAKQTEPYGYIVKPFTKQSLQASVEMGLYKCDMERQRQALLNRVKHLEGMISICMTCKKIRAENRDWQQLEQYITEHSDAVFSHGVCPECTAKAIARPNATAVHVKGKHILYVDDEAGLVRLMKLFLTDEGFRFSGYTDPREALAAVRADPDQFDLVVTDYKMPHLSGLEVAQALKEIRANLPVVLASGYITEEVRAKAPAAGICGLIEKPSTTEGLCEAVARFANAQSKIAA